MHNTNDQHRNVTATNGQLIPYFTIVRNISTVRSYKDKLSNEIFNQFVFTLYMIVTIDRPFTLEKLL